MRPMKGMRSTVSPRIAASARSRWFIILSLRAGARTWWWCSSHEDAHWPPRRPVRGAVSLGRRWLLLRIVDVELEGRDLDPPVALPPDGAVDRLQLRARQVRLPHLRDQNVV